MPAYPAACDPAYPVFYMDRDRDRDRILALTPPHPKAPSLVLCIYFTIRYDPALMFIYTLALLFLTGCTPQEPVPPLEYSWQTIDSRDEGLATQRFPLYRAKVPTGWLRLDPPKEESILDSTKALCEFWIERKVKISVHNFPTEKLEQRVPPSSQIHRWKQQFDSLEPGSITILPQAHGGYTGLLFEGRGMLYGQPATVIGWSMLIAPEHYLHIQGKDLFKAKQMRADYTIKVVGEPLAIAEHKNEILLFGKSFELIEEIPTR